MHSLQPRFKLLKCFSECLIVVFHHALVEFIEGHNLNITDLKLRFGIIDASISPEITQALKKSNPDYKEIANKAVTQTVGRSIYTSLTTLIMVVMLFIFGASTIREFALPLMVGLVVGCYSSICIASGIWYIFRTKIGSKKEAKAAKA